MRNCSLATFRVCTDSIYLAFCTVSEKYVLACSKWSLQVCTTEVPYIDRFETDICKLQMLSYTLSMAAINIELRAVVQKTR